MKTHIKKKGDRFGKLTLIRKKDKNHWECKCDCGKTTSVWSCNLPNGHTKSCGCLFSESLKKRNTKHGFANRGNPHPLYGVWAGMIKRCCNPKDRFYKYYGGRGITICPRWRRSFTNFLSDMEVGWKVGLWIERKDNSRGYSPKNCCWKTRLEQANNKRNNTLLTKNGETITIAQWTRRLGVNRALISGRIYRGWSAKRALTV